MRTGRLSISRGNAVGEPSRAAPQHAEPFSPPAAASADLHAVTARLDALERLARLADQGALAPHEFAAEKAAVLRSGLDRHLLDDPLPPPRHFVPHHPSRRGPSLLGRARWLLLPLGLGGGLLFSFSIQPQETMRFIDQTARALGF